MPLLWCPFEIELAVHLQGAGSWWPPGTCAAKWASALPWQPPAMAQPCGSRGLAISAQYRTLPKVFALELPFEMLETFSDQQVSQRCSQRNPGSPHLTPTSAFPLQVSALHCIPGLKALCCLALFLWISQLLPPIKLVNSELHLSLCFPENPNDCELKLETWKQSFHRNGIKTVFLSLSFCLFSCLLFVSLYY